MKVICVKSSEPNIATGLRSGVRREIPPLHVGSEYNVIRQQRFSSKKYLYYMLEEIPPVGVIEYWYASDFFAHLSEIDETELVNEKELTT